MTQADSTSERNVGETTQPCPQDACRLDQVALTCSHNGRTSNTLLRVVPTRNTETASREIQWRERSFELEVETGGQETIDVQAWVYDPNACSDSGLQLKLTGNGTQESENVWFDAPGGYYSIETSGPQYSERSSNAGDPSFTVLLKNIFWLYETLTPETIIFEARNNYSSANTELKVYPSMQWYISDTQAITLRDQIANYLEAIIEEFIHEKIPHELASKSLNMDIKIKNVRKKNVLKVSSLFKVAGKKPKTQVPYAT